jgi:hypothetical protein
MVAEIDQAQEAYNAWKQQHKLMLKVYTDEETFKIGYWLGAKQAADNLLKTMKGTTCAPMKSTTKKTKSSAASTGKTKP